ncbi:MAG: hypothetical protein IH851_03645 [Armatimonadetes bacterium]|nr:hypothetical protein [Armatimonadota bacterium]
MKALGIMSSLLIASACAQAQFEGDARLEKAVSVRAEAETVRVVLKRLSEDIGVRLAASGALEDDLIVLLAKDRPAREILTIIAEHFDWTWKKEDDGYRLYQTVSSRREEQWQLETLIVRPYLEAQKRARERLEEAGKAEREQVEKEIEWLEEAYAEQRRGRNVITQGSEIDRLRRKITELRALLDPWTRCADTFLLSLGPSRFLELDRRQRLVFALRPTPSQYALPIRQSELAELIVAAVAYREDRIRQIEESSGRTPTGVRRFSAADVANVRITVSFPNLYSRPSADFDIRVEMFDADGVRLTASRGFDLEPYRRPRYGWDLLEEAPKREKNRLDDTPATVELRVLLDRQDQYGNLRVILEARAAFLKGTSDRDPLTGYGTLLTAIAEGGDTAIIADVYDYHSLASGGIRVEKTTVGDLLDTVCGAMRADWRLDGGWVKVRTREWPLYRYATVPRRLLLGTRDLYLKQVGITLDQAAAVAAGVNDYQADSPVLVGILGWIWVVGGAVKLPTLRLWDAIGVTGRGLLSEGGRLEYRRLTPQAKARFGEVVYLSNTLIYAAGDIITDDPDEIADLAWARAAWGTGALEAKGDQEITQLLPSGPLPDSTVELYQVDRLALFLKPESDRFKFYNFQNFAGSSTREGWRERMYSQQCKPAVFGKHMFTFRPGPGVVRGVVLRSAIGDPNVPFGPFSALAEGLRQKIARYEEEFRGGRRGGPPPGMEMAP